MTNKFESFVNKFEQEFKEIVNESELHLDHLIEWEQTHDAILKKIENSFSNSQKIVKLIVGGKLFLASTETLMKIENTYFYGLIANKDKFKHQEECEFLIERNPLVFDRILDYLRTGKLDIRDLTDYMLDMLRDDLDYYCIPSPKEKIPTLLWDVNKKPDNCRFFNNKLTVIKLSGDEHWDCGVIGNIAVDKFTVKIEDRGSNGNIFIGFTTGESWDSNGDNGDNNRDNGWYISLYSGYLFGIGITANTGTYDTSAIINGDYITVIREGNKIRFEKNRIDLGICSDFTDIPNHSLFPALNINDRHVIITLDNKFR